MRVVFMGTPEFAVPSLEQLIKDGHEVVGVFAQPDKPKGRGYKLAAPPVKEAALAHNIPVYQPVKMRDGEALSILKELNPEVIVVVAYGKILPKEILEYPKYGCINIHASLLPKLRGAAPIQWSIINGFEKTGVTSMQMDEGLDTGDMLTKVVVPLEKDETGGSLFDKLSVAGAKLCVETLKALQEGTVTPIPQGDSPTSYAKMLDKQLGNIDWNKSAVEIERLIRGLTPWPSAYTNWQDKVMKIWDAFVCDEANSAEPGTIVKVEKDAFYVQTGKGLLVVRELQIPGKKPMDAGAFLRGYQIKESEMLG